MLIIAHQVNCKNAFGAGFAKYLTSVNPDIKDHYHKSYAYMHKQGLTDHQLLGKVTLFNIDTYAIAHLFTQEYYGNSNKTGKTYTDYKAMDKALCKLRYTYPDATIICPYNIGCGLACGDWNTVSELLNTYNIIPCDKIDIKNRCYHIKK